MNDVSKKYKSMNTVGAVIVLYQPNLDTTIQLLNSVLAQLTHVCLVDNSPNPDSTLATQAISLGAIYHAFGTNQGISHAQNVGVNHLLIRNIEAVLLLDQDSIIPYDYVSRMWEFYENLGEANKRLAAIGPSYIDVKTGRRSYAIRYNYWGGIERRAYTNSDGPIQVDYVIASGSLINIQALLEVGSMNESLFIYWVDVEWGLRALAMGYKSFLIPSVKICHSVGQKVVRIGPIKFVSHDNFRQYFILRNPWLMLRQEHLPLTMRCITIVSLFVKYMPAYWLTSQHKRLTIKTFYLALRDGLMTRGGAPPQF